MEWSSKHCGCHRMPGREQLGYLFEIEVAAAEKTDGF